MKVVLFCGGLGTRMQEHSETIPKPLVEIGYRPMLWHLMRYYSHFGHNEFILCLGHRGDAIKKYFLEYDECLSNDFVLAQGGRDVRLFNQDIEDWTITFVDTGINSNIGQRLRAVKEHLNGDAVFMANYADGLTNLDLNQYLDHFYTHDRIGSFLAVKPSQSFHVVSMGSSSLVADIVPVDESDVWINGGFFAFKQDIFDYLKEGEDLVREPFHRLIARDELIAYKNPGFWACVDTLKEKKMFDDMYARGDTVWAVWEATNKNNQEAALAQSQMNLDILEVQDRSHVQHNGG